MHPWRIDTVVAGFFGLCVLDWVLELCLIELLRWRHHETWIAAGSPSASFWGLIENSFNARKFVMSQPPCGGHGPLLRRYCWFFRVFNALFLASMLITAVLIAIAGITALQELNGFGVPRY